MVFPCFVFEVRHEGLMGQGFQLNDFKSVTFSASSCYLLQRLLVFHFSKR